MLNAMLANHKITRPDDAHLIAPMKRGSRRGAARKTPVISSWLDHQKVMQTVDEIEIGLMKRGSRRGVGRSTPIDTRHWSADEIVIAFPISAAPLPAAANN